MNNTKGIFTIKDLENLTGIKAHTIRIWEKRYGILEPMRTTTNIRVYNGNSLQKLLNINTLNSFGYKISTISKMPEEKLLTMVKHILNNKTLNDHVVSTFKLAMMNFDSRLFYDTYNSLSDSKSFLDIFYDCFMPLLEDIGNLWQTNTITPAHEHFISNLIRQKMAVNIEALQVAGTINNDRTFILYLPENEVHDIGLMLIHYKLLLKGYNTIYLGANVPMENLVDVKQIFDHITFVTYITVDPAPGEMLRYITSIKERVINDDTTQLYFFGRNAQDIIKPLPVNNIRAFNTIQGFTDDL